MRRVSPSQQKALRQRLMGAIRDGMAASEAYGLEGKLPRRMRFTFQRPDNREIEAAPDAMHWSRDRRGIMAAGRDRHDGGRGNVIYRRGLPALFTEKDEVFMRSAGVVDDRSGAAT
jgi:hypothetical protein